MKTDALKRRSRFARPQPLQTRIDLTERDYLIFETLDRHGKLPTNYLFEFTKHVCKDYSFLQRRLTQLYNGYCDDAEHKVSGTAKRIFPVDDEGNQVWRHACKPQSYLMRDWQQFNNFQARYQPVVYGLTDLAKQALAGRALKYSPERNDPFVHQFFGACFSASIELQTTARFITREEIITHTSCPPKTKMLANPFAIPVSDPEMRSIVPDNVFGLEYEDGGFRFFAVEIDRNTETISPKKPVKNSIAKKVRGYTNVLKRKTCHSHFGLPNLTILFATTNATHMERMLAYAREEIEPALHSRFLFKAFPSFGENWRVPRELLPVFEPWRTATGTVDIGRKN